jgi:hypothetical protein
MALRDPATGLSCLETPFYPPQLLKPSDLATCNSCTLVFSAPNAGPKGYIDRSAQDGLGLGESPLASLSYNGTNYALYDTVLWQHGAHRDFGAAANYDMEMNLYFRSIYDISKIIAMAIPITINNSKAQAYFTELADQNPAARNATLESIVVKNQPVLMYKGIDLRGRNASKPWAAQQCGDVSATMTWFILPSTFISSADAGRIRGAQLGSNVSPPAANSVLTISRCRDMCMMIPSLTVKAAAAETAKKEDVYLTRAIQCQRIDPGKDVRNGAVHLKNSNKKSTLSEEIDGIASLDSSLDAVSGGTGMRPRDMENILATCIGVAVAIILFCFIAYFFLQKVYKGYLPAVIQEQALIPAITQAKEKACASFVDQMAAKLHPK